MFLRSEAEDEISYLCKSFSWNKQVKNVASGNLQAGDRHKKGKPDCYCCHVLEPQLLLISSSLPSCNTFLLWRKSESPIKAYNLL